MNDLEFLQKNGSNYKVLIVEDCKQINKKIEEFLKKFFKDIYFAYDGLEGVKRYVEYKPDIILTDINMPNVDGHELVKRITSYDSRVQVIVVSAFGHDDNLFTFNQFGIVEFIRKPINYELLISSLKKSIENIMFFNDGKKVIKNSFNDEVYKKLTDVANNKKSIELVNSFKGLSIVQEAILTDVKKNTITLRTKDSQSYLIRNENQTVVICNDIIFRTNYHYENSRTKEIILKNFEFLDSSLQNRKVIRVAPEESFSLSIDYSRETLRYNVLSISTKAISIKTDILKKGFEEGTLIDLILSFNLSYASHFNASYEDKIYKLTKIKVKAKIFKIEKLKNNINKIVFEFEDPSDESIQKLDNYITQRKINIMEEFQKI